MARLAQPVSLVAGGAGFLGSHLCERLLGEGHAVVCLDNLQTGTSENLRRFERESRFSFVEADVCELPARLRADHVYNLACAASPPLYQADPVHTMMTSVVGTRNLLEVARRSGGRMLQASTSEVYGDPEEHPQRESYRGSVNPIGIRACYDEGKRAGEALCFDYRRTYGTDVRVARIFNTYGPRMRPDDGRIVSNLIVQALSGAPLTIYGDGEQTRSFCYVSDLIEGLSRLMAVDPNPEMPVNLGNPEEYTINGLAELVLDLTGSRSEIRRLPLPADDPQCRRPDISRAQALLGWSPKTPVVEGLAATIAWFDAGRSAQRDAAPARQAAVQAAAAGGGAG
jgi:UDP-glucuronate decarboxylase